MFVNPSKKGFTLIELLIAISIIAVLSTIGLSIYQGIQSKARDSIRKGDLNKLAMALEIYAQQHNGSYISGITTCPQPTDTTNTFYTNIASNMSDGILPKDPKDNKTLYCYISVNNGQSFRLFAKLENCNNSGGNLCTYTSYNYSIYSDGLLLASAAGDTIVAALPSSTSSTGGSTGGSTGTIQLPSSLANGLVGYWRMDETSWNDTASEVLDSSGSNKNGTANNGATTTTGQFNRAGNFDGTDDYIDIPSFSVPSQTGSVSLWLYPTSYNSDILSAGAAGNYFRLSLGSGIYGYSYYGFNTAYGEYRIVISASSNPSLNTWTHLVVTWDNTGTKLYLNNFLRGTSDLHPPPFSQLGLNIGRYIAGGNHFNGKIDDVRFYNRVLTITEIDQLFNQGATTPSTPTSPLGTAYNPKVLLVIYNPLQTNGQKLSIYRGWNDPNALTNSFISKFSIASGGLVNYTIAQQVEIDGYPVKNNGFQMTNDYYNTNCVLGTTNSNCTAKANYVQILNNVNVDACGKRNSGQIDEVWIWGGGPGFGFWESNLAGPNAFFYNSSPTTGTTCNKLLPIMGFNYERGEPEMFEDFSHRTEFTMWRVFGSWATGYDIASATPQNDWDRFTVLDNQSSGNGGCGNAHTAVNSSATSGEYDRINTRTTKSHCKDFANYPNLTGTTEDINCGAWGCTNLDYYIYWFFKYLPHAAGSNNGKLNNWWAYLVDPQGTIIDGSVQGVSTINLKNNLLQSLKQWIHLPKLRF